MDSNLAHGTTTGTTMQGQARLARGRLLADVNVPVTRAITGGTGPFRAAQGEQSQVLLGFTAEMGVNLRVSLDVHPR